MKRLLLLLPILLLLMACGSEEPEKKNYAVEFAEKYNEHVVDLNKAENSVPYIEEIAIDDIGKQYEEGKGYWQTAQTTSKIDGEGYYEIDLKLNKEKELDGYHISINGDSDKVDSVYHNRGIAVIPITLKVIGLDTDKYSVEFDKFLNSKETEYSYADMGYEVSFLNFNDLDYFIVNVDKLE